ncbi:hypothetical protein EG359_22525 (plasmid) [Chryseobacterium joostei]|uniref:Type IV secretory system Conjugative DNA transfer n=2 Tax=Chryseobacterium joostei TaxID=112234 RepID=A0A1N7KG96_9FLAO|nr:hypothetical protein EG359_22525 [Chryseobacterium joostei]SIS60626.1 Type IV secretory system Conjugative DNA transfer [Chryseobacterium joostei]
MKSKQSFILFSVIFYFAAFFVLSSVIMDDTIDGNAIHKWTSRRDISENQLKFFMIMPLIIIANFSKNYSEKLPKIENITVIGLVSLAILFIPANFLIFLPRAAIVGIYFLCFATNLGLAFMIGTYLFSKKAIRDQFNDENETFEQTREKIETPFSLNLEYEFYFEGKWNKGWVNLINVFAGIWIFGLMNSGKSFTWFLQAIYQFIKKDYTLAVFDYKFPELTNITYKMHKRLKSKNNFFVLCLDDATVSNRCNPISNRYIKSVQDMDVLSEIFIKSNNNQFDKFFDGSAQGILTAIMYILRVWERKHGIPVCSVSHAMILSSVKIDYLLPQLLSQRDILAQVTSVRDGFLAAESSSGQLAGQLGSLANNLRSLISKDILYILSGNDFDLELNNPDNPKILCIGSSQKKAQITAPIVSVFFEIIARETNVVNKKRSPFMILGDEFARVFFKSLPEYVSSGRSNQCGIMAGMQGIPQLEERLKKEVSSAIVDITANLICGKAGNETAKYVSERIGKTNQKRTNLQESAEGEYSFNHGTDKDYLVSQSRISTLGVGEFCGTIVDEYNLKIKQKRFFGRFLFDKNITPILEDNNEIEKLIKPDPVRVEHFFQLHKNEMETYGFFDTISSTKSGELYQKIYIFDFYILFLELDLDGLENLIYKDLSSRELREIEELKEIVYERLRKKIESNEIDKFLTDHQNQLYDQIEEIVRAEYFEMMGKKIQDDLFNVENKTETLITKEELF